MTIEQDPRTRVVLSWLREDAHENPERLLLRALDEVDATPQRRSWWPAWRSSHMNTYAKLVVAAAAVVAVAVVGYQFLPRSTGVGGSAAATPSPSPPLLARGNFVSHGVKAELDATGTGTNVQGTMSLLDAGNRATVALECTQTTDRGLVVIGGLVTESTFVDGFPQGYRVAVLLQKGSPVKGVWWVTGTTEAPKPSCQALVDSIDEAEASTDLEPISGTLDFGP